MRVRALIFVLFIKEWGSEYTVCRYSSLVVLN